MHIKHAWYQVSTYVKCHVGGDELERVEGGVDGEACQRIIVVIGIG